MQSHFLAAVLAAALAVPATAQTVTVETATGPADVPANPETVVVLDIAALDTIDALGLAVAGVPEPVYLAYLDDVAAGAMRAGTLFEPDFEALAAMAPDLIIAGGRSSTQVEPLSKIAPAIDMTIWGSDLLDQAKARTAAYGALFSKGTEAGELTDALDAKIASATEAVFGKGNALIVLTNGGKISAYGDDSRFGWLHTALGLPEAYPELDAETHGESVSFEFIAEVNPDWILVVDRGAAIGADGEAAAATLDNPLVAGTTAATNGQIVYLDSAPLYIAGGGIQSVNGTLDQIIAAFNGE